MSKTLLLHMHRIQLKKKNRKAYIANYACMDYLVGDETVPEEVKQSQGLVI